MSDELKLEDLSPEDRRALKYDNPLLNDYAARMEQQHKLPSGLLVAVKNAGEQSSSEGKGSVSPKGAVGVMQLMPATVKQHSVADPTDPMQSIEGAAKHLAWISSKNNTQDPTLLAAAYNAGPNNMSVRRGEVPRIPETQAYVSRVNAHLKDAQTLKPEDLTHEDRVALTRQAMASEYAPTKGMSATELALAGAGKAVSDTATGMGQLATDWMVNPASRALMGRNIITDMKPDVAETEARDAPLMRTVPGMLGYMGGSTAVSAIPAGIISRAAPVARLAGLASTVPKIGRAASLAIPAAAVGLASGAATPIASEGERGRNMALQAALGPLTVLGVDAASRGASRLAATPLGQRVAAAVKSPFEAAGTALESVPGYAPARGSFRAAVVGPSYMSGATESERAAIETAAKEGVPVYGSQLRKPGAPVSASRTEGQRSAFDRAVARSFGENTDDLNQAFKNAEERLGAQYQTLLGGKKIPLDKAHLNDLADITKFNNSRSPRFAPSPDLQDAVERAAAATQQNGHITGEDFQQALRQYKAAAKQALKGTELRPSDPHAAEGYQKLIDALTQQAEKTLSKEDLALFRQTNKQWRNMSMLDAIAPRDLEGNIQPRQLANLLARKDKGAFVYGKGDQTLTNLAKYGSTYMEHPGTAPKGIVAKTQAMAAKTAPMLLGDLIAGAALSEGLGQHEPNESFASKMGGYLAWAAAAEAARRGYNRVTNPALGMKELAEPQGALARVVRQGYAPGVARTVNEEVR